MIFNRKIFNPSNSKEERKTLDQLRQVGFSRSCLLRQEMENDFENSPPNKFYKIRSTAYEEVHWKNKKNGTFVDLGCGHSADTKIAILEGFKNVYAIDLFPVNNFWDKISLFKKTGREEYKLKHPIKFIQQDMVEKISIKPNSVDIAVCQAVVDLIEPLERTKFYKNVYKILKNNGYFSCYIVNLSVGYGTDIAEERKKCLNCGFRLYHNYSGGFLLQKCKA